AVTPADVRKLVGIGDAARDERIDAGYDVLEVAAAPVVDVGRQRLLAVVRAAARVRIKHRPPLAGPHLPAFETAEAEAVHIRAGGTAVRHHQRRVALAGLEADRLQQHAFHLDA